MTTYFKRNDDQRQQRREEREVTTHIINLWKSGDEAHEKRQQRLTEELEREQKAKGNLQQEVEQLKLRIDTESSAKEILQSVLRAVAANVMWAHGAAWDVQTQELQGNQQLRLAFMTDICTKYQLDSQTLTECLGRNVERPGYEAGVLAMMAFDIGLNAGEDAQFQILRRSGFGTWGVTFIHENPAAEPEKVLLEVHAALTHQVKCLQFEQSGVVGNGEAEAPVNADHRLD